MRSHLCSQGLGNLLRTGFLCGLLGSSARPQTSAVAQFEVASVRENVSHSTESAISTSSPDRLVITNVPLRFLVLYAYDLPDHRLAGMPGWSEDKSFDIGAVYPQGERPSEEEIRMMMQGLLSDRFQLKVHHEQRELPAYRLELARGDGRLGSQMKVSHEDCSGPVTDKRGGAGAQAPRESTASASGKEPMCSMAATRKRLWGSAASLGQLAATLQVMAGRPVVDETGLSGRYDVTLHWEPMQPRADNGVDGDAGGDEPSLFSGLREQLGLKLVAHKESFDVLVVDSVAAPTRD